jgi:hypothetical protein
MNGPDEKTAAQIGTDAHKTAEEMSDVEYVARRARDLGMDDEARVFEELMERDDSRKRVVVVDGLGMGLGAAVAAAGLFGGPLRDRSRDTFSPMPSRGVPRGAVQVAPGIWARDPANKPKKPFKGSKAAKKASRKRR